MPPSLRIDNVSIVEWEDLAGNVKRSAITFTDAESVTFGSGNANNPIRLTNLATPTSSTDATTKQYVDATILGLSLKAPVRAVAVADGALATAYAEGAVVDGVTLVAGDRILLLGQADPIENGLYLVAATGAPARTTDLVTGVAASGVYVFVDQGTVYKDRAYVCITDRGTDVVDTNGLQFVQFSARSSAIAGQGLVVGAAEELDVNVDNATLTILGDVVQVQDLGITNGKLANATIENAKLVNPSLAVNTARGLLGGQTVALGAAATLQPDFTVVPDLAATNLFAADNTFSGAVTLSSTVHAVGAATLDSTLAVTGATTLSNTAHLVGAATLDSTLAVTGAATLSDALAVTGATTLSSTVHAVGAATLDSTLAVTGATTLSNTAHIVGAATLDSTLAVAGAATLSDTLAVTGTVTAPRVTGLLAPTAASDAVNLVYMTNSINNATQGGAARAVAVAPVTLSGLAVGSVVDGVTLALDDRVLLAGQTDPVENGVYVVAAAGPPARAANLPIGGSAAALSLVVREGTLYADRLFLCTTVSGADVVGTNPLAFTYVAQSLTQAAGPAGANTTALRHDDALACLAVRTDNVAIEIDGRVTNKNFTIPLRPRFWEPPLLTRYPGPRRHERPAPQGPGNHKRENCRRHHPERQARELQPVGEHLARAPDHQRPRRPRVQLHAVRGLHGRPGPGGDERFRSRQHHPGGPVAHQHRGGHVPEHGGPHRRRRRRHRGRPVREQRLHDVRRAPEGADRGNPGRAGRCDGHPRLHVCLERGRAQRGGPPRRAENGRGHRAGRRPGRRVAGRAHARGRRRRGPHGRGVQQARAVSHRIRQKPEKKNRRPRGNPGDSHKAGAPLAAMQPVVSCSAPMSATITLTLPDLADQNAQKAHAYTQQQHIYFFWFSRSLRVCIIRGFNHNK